MNTRYNKKLQESPVFTKRQSSGSSNEAKMSSTKGIQSSSTILQSHSRISEFVRVAKDSTESSLKKDTYSYECEGIPIHSRGKSKGVYYFDCSSHRLKNTPDCHFRAKVKDLDPLAQKGAIEIIQEHSKTCKYIVGNTTTDFNQASTRTYKTMKIEIIKKLEEEDWLTPSQVLKWIELNFPLDCHLSYSQVDEIVQAWRKKNSATKESYIFSHSKNRTGLTFFRGYYTLNYKKNNSNKSFKIVIWASDFQINRLRLTNHWYIDGTFTITPCNYSQLITFAIRDPNTGYIKPALWALLDSKDEECYYHLFKVVKDIADASGTLKWNLASVTLDFEQALINAFSRIFVETRVIGCLFHLKQALYREAQALGITKEALKEETKKVVSLLGSLSWRGSDSAIDAQLQNLEKAYHGKEQRDLIIYYKNNWLPKLKSGLIDYSDVEDEFRSNSILEHYQCHVKDSLPRSSSWPKFIDFLITEEESYVRDSIAAEQRGQVAFKSVNFGKTFLPKPIKKITCSNIPENTNQKQKQNKRKIDFISKEDNDKISIITDIKKQTKLSYCQTVSNSVQDTNNSSNMKITIPRKCKESLNKVSWIKWKNYSCRYDSFLTIFALTLYPKFKEFHESSADKRHKNYNHYVELCNSSVSLSKAKTIVERQNIVEQFWVKMFLEKFDDTPPGSMGIIQQLMGFFKPLICLQPYIKRVQVCRFCEFNESKKIRMPLPISIQDLGDLNFSSIQQYYDWFINEKNLETCEICLQEQKEVYLEDLKQEPTWLFIELILRSTQEEIIEQKFTFDLELFNQKTKSKFQLLATLNHPSDNHFNCSVFQPHLERIINY